MMASSNVVSRASSNEGVVCAPAALGASCRPVLTAAIVVDSAPTLVSSNVVVLSVFIVSFLATRAMTRPEPSRKPAFCNVIVD